MPPFLPRLLRLPSADKDTGMMDVNRIFFAQRVWGHGTAAQSWGCPWLWMGPGLSLPRQGEWNQMIFRVPSNHSTIPWISYPSLLPPCCRAEGWNPTRDGAAHEPQPQRSHHHQTPHPVLLFVSSVLLVGKNSAISNNSASTTCLEEREKLAGKKGSEGTNCNAATNRASSMELSIQITEPKPCCPIISSKHTAANEGKKTQTPQLGDAMILRFTLLRITHSAAKRGFADLRAQMLPSSTLSLAKHFAHGSKCSGITPVFATTSTVWKGFHFFVTLCCTSCGSEALSAEWFKGTHPQRCSTAANFPSFPSRLNAPSEHGVPLLSCRAVPTQFIIHHQLLFFLWPLKFLNYSKRRPTFHSALVCDFSQSDGIIATLSPSLPNLPHQLTQFLKRL